MALGPLMVDLRGDSLSAQERTVLMSPAVGGVILFDRNFTSVAALVELVNEIHALQHPQLLVAVDQEGGRVQRLRQGFTRLPAIRALGKVYEEDPSRARELAELTGWLMAAELRAVGIDFSFAPVLDLDRGVSEVIGDRAFHGDPEVVSELASQYVRGMRRAGMRAVGKHFPGHGGVAADSHVDLPTDSRKYEDVMTQDLIPFRRMVDYSLAGIMSAHVVYERVDEDIATYSHKWLDEVLRRQLAFKGAVFSDDLGMSAADCGGEYAGRAQRALRAGCDMVLICNAPEQARAAAERFDDYNDPAAQVRLMDMRGGEKPLSYRDLRATEGWRQAASQVASYKGLAG